MHTARARPGPPAISRQTMPGQWERKRSRSEGKVSERMKHQNGLSVGKLLYCHGCFILMLILDDFGALGVFEAHKCPFTFNVFLFSLRCAMLSPSFITRCPGIQSLYKNYACYLETRSIEYHLCALLPAIALFEFPWLISSITPTHSLDARVTVFSKRHGLVGNWWEVRCGRLQTHFPVNHDSGWTMS